MKENELRKMIREEILKEQEEDKVILKFKNLGKGKYLITANGIEIAEIEAIEESVPVKKIRPRVSEFGNKKFFSLLWDYEGLCKLFDKETIKYQFLPKNDYRLPKDIKYIKEILIIDLNNLAKSLCRRELEFKFE